MPASARKEEVTRNAVAQAARVRVAERVPLSWEMALELVVCGVMVAGLSLMMQELHSSIPRVTCFTGVAGGGLCILWGLLGRRGTPCRMGAMMTLATVACVLAFQAMRSWGTSAEGESKERLVVALMIVMVVFCVGMLVNLVQDAKALHHHLAVAEDQERPRS